MNRRTALFACMALLACDSETDTAAPAARSDRDRSAAFADAVATARAEVPEGIPVEVEIEHLDGRELIEVEMLVDGRIREVYLDPESGDVVAVKDEEGSEQSQQPLLQSAAAVADAELTLTEAADKARGQGGGTVREVEYKMIDGKLVVDVELHTDGGVKNVRLDAADGRVLSTTNAGSSEEEDEHEEHDEHE